MSGRLPGRRRTVSGLGNATSTTNWRETHIQTGPFNWTLQWFSKNYIGYEGWDCFYGGWRDVESDNCFLFLDMNLSKMKFNGIRPQMFLFGPYLFLKCNLVQQLLVKNQCFNFILSNWNCIKTIIFITYLSKHMF